MRGVDFAWGVVPGKERALARALRAEGFGFVVRYLSQDPSKNLTKAEVAAYRAEGLLIVTVYEDAAQSMLGGATVGRSQAERAKAQLEALDAPAHAPVYFAADWDVQPAQMSDVDAALDATAFVLSESLNGIYGGYGTTSKAQHVHYRWQTLGWSDGQWDGKDVLEQVGVGNGVTLGVQWDLDESKVSDFGQWRWPAPAPKPARRKPTRTGKVARKVAAAPKHAATRAKKVARAEPVMTAASAQAVAASAIAWWAKDAGLHWTATQQHAALVIVTALAGMVAAAFTRPARVTVFFTGLGTAAAAATAFGLHMSPQWLAAEAPAAALFIGGLLRVHVSPAAVTAAAAASPAPAALAAPATPSASG